jgi:hypothetical protein
VACLPDPAQALRYAVRVTQGAFAPAAVRFTEFARLAAVACGGGRAAVLSARSAAGQGAAAIAGLRELGDQWGHHVRRLAAHAEIAVVLGDRTAARAMLDAARAVPSGYAGYRAPAQLALADACGILGDPARRDAALDQALQSAHNIQEPTFCALTTARVSTLVVWWADPHPRLPELVTAFVADPEAPRFGPRHRLGEPFRYRERHDHLSVDEITQASDARSLAAALDIAEARLVDPGPGTAPATIVLPDPDFAPLVAAYLSARIAASDLPHPDRVRLTAALVPVAVADATALDLVLGRWIVALGSGDADLAALLDPLSQRSTVEPAGGWEAGVA